MRTYQAPDMTHLHEDMCQSLLLATDDELDIITGVDVQIHNVIAEADTMNWEFDLKSMWLTPPRWTMMVRQYLDGEELLGWLDIVTSKIGLKGRGTAVLRTKVVKPRGGAATGHTNRLSRKWGSCMLAISYKAKPAPQITLHSRTSYLGYLGGLDLSVAWMVGRYLAHAMGEDVSQFKFVWMIESIQWHNFKSLAYMLCHDDPDTRALYRRLLIKPLSKLNADEVATIEVYPALRLSRQWLRKLMLEDAQGKTYGDMNYNTYRRIRRRWHTEVLGYEKAQEFEGWGRFHKGPKKGELKEYYRAYHPLPSTPVQTLDFRTLKMPWDGSYGSTYVGGFKDDDDD